MPVLPWGGGSGTQGTCIPVEGGIVVDMTAMSRILVAVPELVVHDLGEGALGYVDRTSGARAWVVGDQVVEGGAGGI